MRRAVVVPVLAFAAFAAGPVSAAPEEPGAHLREDIDVLAKRLAGSGTEPDGPSPTARVNRSLAAGDKRLKRVLAEAWSAVLMPGVAPREREAVRRIVRFFVSLPDPPAPGTGDAVLVEEGGIVRIRRDAAAPVLDADEGDGAAPSFDSLVKGGRLRWAARPDVKAALDALRDGTVPANERFDVARAVGEICAPRQPMAGELARRVDMDPRDPWLLTAFAWSRAANAEGLLRTALAAGAGKAARGEPDGVASFLVVASGLRHVRADALADEIGRLEGPAREAALTAAGLDIATPIDAAALANPTNPDAYRATLASLTARVLASAETGEIVASPQTRAELVRALAASLDSVHGEPGPYVHRAAEALLAAHDRHPVTTVVPAAGGVGIELQITGERVGPYPGTDALLATAALDLANGDVTFTGGERTIFDRIAETPTPTPKRLLSDVAPPDLERDAPKADDVSTLRLRGSVALNFLRLEITNTGPAAITVNPVAFRYATAEFTEHTRYAGPGATKKYHALHVILGHLNAQVATPADRLVTLAPMESYSFSVELRPEHKGAEHVSVSMDPAFAVIGAPPAPLLSEFARTWVK